MGTRKLELPDEVKFVTYWYNDNYTRWIFKTCRVIKAKLFYYGNQHTDIAGWDHELSKEELYRVENDRYPYTVSGMLLFLSNVEAKTEKPKYMQWYKCYNCGYMWANNQENATCLMCESLGRKVTWQENVKMFNRDATKGEGSFKEVEYKLHCSTCGAVWYTYNPLDKCQMCFQAGRKENVSEVKDGAQFTHICTQCNNVFVGTMEDTTCPNCKAKAEHTVQHSDGTALEKQEGGSHYKDMKIQPVEFIHANNIPFIEGCCIKYLCRWRRKGGVEDLKKVVHFVELLIELEEKS